MSPRPGGSSGRGKKPKRAGGKGPKRPETPRGQTPPKRKRPAAATGEAA
ncbi:MAG: hypothetical protein JWO90_2906, partial [Solirubrobacterales bacterium]|nr:hypothetical protein [Solirubrobacterales bacterium]